MVQSSRAEWLRGLRADIEVVRKAGLRPLSFVLRLEEIAAGMKRSADWYDFRVPCRGLSHQDIQGSQHVVSLEFHDADRAREVFAQLNALKEQFQVITTVTCFNHNEYVTINLKFDVFAE